MGHEGMKSSTRYILTTVFFVGTLLPAAPETFGMDGSGEYHDLSLREIMDVAQEGVDEIDRQLEERAERERLERRETRAEERYRAAKVLYEHADMEGAIAELEVADRLTSDRELSERVSALKRKALRQKR